MGVTYASGSWSSMPEISATLYGLVIPEFWHSAWSMKNLCSSLTHCLGRTGRHVPGLLPRWYWIHATFGARNKSTIRRVIGGSLSGLLCRYFIFFVRWYLIPHARASISQQSTHFVRWHCLLHSFLHATHLSFPLVKALIPDAGCSSTCYIKYISTNNKTPQQTYDLWWEWWKNIVAKQVIIINTIKWSKCRCCSGCSNSGGRSCRGGCCC